MNKKSIYIYIAASLAFLVPPPGRFVYGLVLVFELNFLMLLGTCLSFLIKRFDFETVETPFYLIVITSATILTKQVLMITQTGIALTLGFDLYLPAVSAFLIGYLHNKSHETFSEKIKYNMSASLKFSIFALCFYLFRDVAGYGTFTFFGKNHRIYEKIICNPERISVLSFFATIPGALILCAVILAVYIFINRKLRIVKRSTETNGELQSPIIDGVTTTNSKGGK